MHSTVDPDGKLLPDDQRMSPIGRFLRRTSFDEFPQLINVLKNEMSIVGPRPLPVEYSAWFNKRQSLRLLVKPGLTGWCQVKYHGKERSWDEKLEDDVFYVENKGIILDFHIIAMTFKVLWKRFYRNPKGLSTSAPLLTNVIKKTKV